MSHPPSRAAVRRPRVSRCARAPSSPCRPCAARPRLTLARRPIDPRTPQSRCLPRPSRVSGLRSTHAAAHRSCRSFCLRTARSAAPASRPAATCRLCRPRSSCQLPRPHSPTQVARALSHVSRLRHGQGRLCDSLAEVFLAASQACTPPLCGSIHRLLLRATQTGHPSSLHRSRHEP